METVLRHVNRDVPAVTPDTSVQEAAERMKLSHCGVVVVLDWWSAVGLFSEHDLAQKVVSERLNPMKTPVSEVMSCKPITVPGVIDPKEALQLMKEHDCQFLLLVSPEGDYEGVVSVENLLEDCNEALTHENQDLLAYLNNDLSVKKSA